MKLDRDFQRSIMEKLADSYPGRCQEKFPSEIEDKYFANLLYLEEHDLVSAGVSGGPGHYSYWGAKITAKGLDFLQDDGGLTAILGTVTVKIHEDSIRALLERQIETSAATPEEKKTLLDKVKTLSGKALEHTMFKLLDLGLEKAPDAWLLIQRAIQ